MPDNLFDAFTASVLYPGAEKIVNATTNKIAQKITGTASGENNTVNNSVSAVAPSGASQVARAINDSLSGVGGVGIALPILIIGGVAAYLLLKK